MGDPLTVPTDLEILETLAGGKRQTPANVAAILNKERKYMSDRLRKLEDRGYLRDAPPADRSGMYEITATGLIAAFHTDEYVRSYHDTFHRLCEIVLNHQPEDRFLPDLIVLDEWRKYAFLSLASLDGITIPSEHPRDAGGGSMTETQVRKGLYTAYYFGLGERKDGMDVYESSPLGDRCRDLMMDGATDPTELTLQLREEYPDERRRRVSRMEPCLNCQELAGYKG